MDNFLAQAATVGETNSSGEFTISHQEALRKLRDFQLPRRGAFASNLVAAVVLAGGSEIAVVVSDTVISFQFDQPAFSQDDLEMLFLSPFQSGAPQWRKEMAISANGTLGLPLQYLILDSWNAENQEGWELKSFSGGRQSVQALTRPFGQSSFSRFSLHFGYQRGFRINDYLTPISQELRERCCHAPIALSMNSRVISHDPISGSTEIARRVWRTESDAPGAVLPGKAGADEEVTHQEPFSALMEVAPKDKGEVTLIVNGVSFPAPPNTFKLPRWVRLVIAAPYLAKDLSQASVTQGRPIRLLAKWAQSRLSPLLEDRCRTFRNLGREPLRHFHDCLEEVFGKQRSQPVQDWFDHQELINLATSPDFFEELAKTAKKTQRPPPCSEPLAGASTDSKTGLFRSLAAAGLGTSDRGGGQVADDRFRVDTALR